MIADRNNSACAEPSRCRADAGASLALPLLARVFDLLPAAPGHPERAHIAAVTGGHSAARRAAPVAHAAGVGRRTVTIRAMGGSRPLIFLVDGAPLPAERVSGPRLVKKVQYMPGELLGVLKEREVAGVGQDQQAGAGDGCRDLLSV